MFDTTRTGYQLFLGACPSCSTGIARKGDAQSATCEKCGTKVALRGVRGVYAESVPCDDRCQYAIGPVCACGCSGENHGRGYITPIGERPEWVLARDAKRQAAKVERQSAKTRKARTAIEDRQAELLAQHPELAWLSYLDDADMHNGSDFMIDMVAAFDCGRMTERQATAASRAIVRETERHARRVEREVRDAELIESGFTYPTGRVDVTGTIVSVKDRPGYAYNTTVWQMLVAVDEGWKVWMTLPRTLIEWAMDRQRDEQESRRQERVAAAKAAYEATGELPSLDAEPFVPWTAYLVNHRVAFTATLQGSDKDPLFGFGARPSKARMVEEVNA